MTTKISHYYKILAKIAEIEKCWNIYFTVEYTSFENTQLYNLKIIQTDMCNKKEEKEREKFLKLSVLIGHQASIKLHIYFQNP